MGKLSHERAEFLIPTQAFIYCKYNSNDAKQSNLRLSHIYHKLFNWLKEYIDVCPVLSHPFFTTKGW